MTGGIYLQHIELLAPNQGPERHAADFMFLLLVQTSRCARHSHMERPTKPRLQP
jgi:hypothetical protein